jgi:topoisomerase-4 subunit A
VREKGLKILENVVNKTLVEIATKNTKEYGAYTIEQRALADYRDGLLPVYRRILWAMYKLGLHHKGSFKKAARTVGDVIGQYHPHGDMSTYQSMVGMAGTKDQKGNWAIRNCVIPTIEGQGNWGNYNDRAAAQRYTEARLTEYADKLLLDPDYLAVADMAKNFSGDMLEPIILPAKLPNLLLNGSEGIATGISAYIPAFQQDGVVKLIKMILKGKKANPKNCLKYLVATAPYGGENVTLDEDMLIYYKTGKATLYFQPTFEKHEDRFSITSIAPRFNLVSQMNRIAGFKGVMRVCDESGVDKKTWKRDVRIVVYYKRGLEKSERMELNKKLENQIITGVPCQTAVTIRNLDETVSFKRTSVPSILNDWVAWRVELEVKVVRYLLQKEQDKLNRLLLIILAVINLRIVIASLESKDPDAYLMKHLKIKKEEAAVILDLKVRALAKLNQKELNIKVAECKKIMAALNKDLKNPQERVLRSL